MTEHGHVARGICVVSEDGYLQDINERTRIEKRNGKLASILKTEKTGLTIPGKYCIHEFLGLYSWFHEGAGKNFRFSGPCIGRGSAKRRVFPSQRCGFFVKGRKATVKVCIHLTNGTVLPTGRISLQWLPLCNICSGPAYIRKNFGRSDPPACKLLTVFGLAISL
jgi:hypothetical protein